MRLGLSILLRVLHLKHECAARFGEFPAERLVISRRPSDWRQVGERRVEIHERQQQGVYGDRVRVSGPRSALDKRCVRNLVKNAWWHLLALRKRPYIEAMPWITARCCCTSLSVRTFAVARS